MAYSLWEFLTFSPAVLRQRERTLTWKEREEERLEALRQYEKAAIDSTRTHPT